MIFFRGARMLCRSKSRLFLNRRIGYISKTKSGNILESVKIVLHEVLRNTTILFLASAFVLCEGREGRAGCCPRMVG